MFKKNHEIFNICSNKPIKLFKVVNFLNSLTNKPKIKKVRFQQADVLYVTDIYSAGEVPIPGVTGESLAQRIQANGHPSVNWIGEKEGLIKQVLPTLVSGDVVLTLGAGDIWKVGSELLECL